MIYITGDTHGEFERFNYLKQAKDDMVIILGDVCLNYFLNEYDEKLKDIVSSYGLKLFCIQGNHEERPENIQTYKEKNMFGGKVYVEDKYPNIMFAKNGELYNINNKKILVVGGAYSVDKDLRIKYGYKWFKDEQLSLEEQEKILNKYKGKHIDVVLSHTAPYKYEPRESFKLVLEQSKIDKSMEKFLDKLEESITYDKWYCGHYHIEKKIDKLEFMFGRIKIFLKDEFVPKFNRDGYEIIRDFCNQETVHKNEVCCPKCNGKNILIQKGEGEKIYGLDEIAIICNDCKKVYGFKDVNYKPNCPKEL